MDKRGAVASREDGSNDHNDQHKDGADKAARSIAPAMNGLVVAAFAAADCETIGVAALAMHQDNKLWKGCATKASLLRRLPLASSVTIQ